MADYEKELAAAIEAGRLASRLCERVQKDMRRTGDGSVQKKDKSPVTIADFGAQALVNSVLEQHLPADRIVGEEAAELLRKEEQRAIKEQVVAQVTAQRPNSGEAQVLSWIDRGNHQGGSDRFWTLDPIDGTKGFLRGEQYAVALCLVIDSVPTVGVLACPNLPAEWGQESGARGFLFAAVRGQGTKVLPLEGGPGRAIHASSQTDPRRARVLESVEKAHGDHDAHDEVKALLGVEVESVRLDSQAKYGVLSRGEAEVYLRLPTKPGYREWIWDQAAGVVVIEEAGGRVTDARGRPLDFSLGRRLENNEGVVATNGPIHDRVIEQVLAVLSRGGQA